MLHSEVIKTNSKIDQIHLTAVMLCMSEMSKIVKESFQILDDQLSALSKVREILVRH